MKAYHKHGKIGLSHPVFTGLMLQEDQAFVTSMFKCLAKLCPKLFPDSVSVEEERKGVDDTFRTRVVDWIKERWKAIRALGRRDMCSFVETIPICQEFFPMAEYNDFFLGEFVCVIKSGSKEAKRLASHAFCTLFLRNYISASRAAALTKVLDMAKALTCLERLGLLTFAEIAADYFSRQFLADQGVIRAYLSLAEDKVANVRIRFAAICPRMIKAIKLDTDRTQLRTLLACLENDLDRDVRKLAKDALQELKQPPVASDLATTKAQDLEREKREQELVAKEREEEAARQRLENERRRLERQYSMNPEEMRKAKAYSRMLQNSGGRMPRRKISEKSKPVTSMLPAKVGDLKHVKAYQLLDSVPRRRRDSGPLALKPVKKNSQKEFKLIDTNGVGLPEIGNKTKAAGLKTARISGVVQRPQKCLPPRKVK